MKDYNLLLKVRNNYLLTAMRENGIETAQELSRAAGVPPSEVGRYLNLKKAPYNKYGDLTPGIVKIATCLKRSISSLFPESHLYIALEKNTGEVEISTDEISGLLSDFSALTAIEHSERDSALLDVIETLKPIEREVITKRFGFYGEPMLLKDIAKDLGLSGVRIGAIEAKALRKMRHPNNSDKYRP
jgi:hypothetical protein